MAEVHDFRALRLQQAADHVDGGVVAIEQRGRRDKPQRRVTRRRGRIQTRLLHRPAVGIAHRRTSESQLYLLVSILPFTRR
ncbi:MAG: hypothetical protein RL580_2362 [Pseudomonadota bacterium]